MWTNVASGVIHDRGWVDPLVSFYRWFSGVDQYVEQRQSLAQVALVCSPNAVRSEGSDAPTAEPSALDALDGWSLALMRNRVPFDLIAEWQVAETPLSKYDTVIIPNGTPLSDNAAARARVVRRQRRRSHRRPRHCAPQLSAPWASGPRGETRRRVVRPTVRASARRLSAAPRHRAG